MSRDTELPTHETLAPLRTHVDRRLLPLMTTSADDPDREAAEELERLRASLGFIDEAPARMIDDRYQIEQTIGFGGMGIIYLARDTKLPRQVALKLVRTRPFFDRAHLQHRLAREAELLAQVDHPNVVTVYDVGDHRGDLYVAMQHVCGKTLGAWQAELRPSVDELLDAYLQAGRGLAAAHAAGVVHRDFKPDNVLVGDNGVVRVVDFGIADALRSSDRSAATVPPLRLAGGDEPDVLSNPLTRPGALLGTPAYMAPPQLEGAKAEARDDQFAFCVSLWESLTGTRPFMADNALELLRCMQRGLTIDEKLPRPLRSILARGLAYSREHRFPDMHALVLALEHARARKRRRRGISLAGVGLVLAGVVGWQVSGLDTRTETCDEFQAEVSGIWNDDTREALRARAADRETIDYAITTLDALHDRWQRDAAQLCEHAAAPAHDHEARRCMEGWLDDLARHVDHLSAASDARALALVPDLLSHLSPPQGDYCALRPAGDVDPGVWQLSQAVREAARAGERERAAELIGELDRLVDERAAGQTYTAERAETLSARGELSARSGQLDEGLEQLERAEKQAIGAGYDQGLLTITLFMAKVAAQLGDARTIAHADDQLDRARPMLAALELGSFDPLRGELHETCGVVARAQGQQQRAIDCHERASELFAALDRAPQVARSLNNIGANALELGELERAATAYGDALAQLDAAGVPSSYPTRVEIEFNLGLIALAREDHDGVDHFEFVVDHATALERLEAMALAAQLLAIGEAGPNDHEFGQLDAATDWGSLALAELEAATDVPLELGARVEAIAGSILAERDDPRGEALLVALLGRRGELDPMFVLGIEQTWIERLERQARCDAAGQRLDALLQWSRELGLEAQLTSWRDARQDSLCKRSAGAS